MVMIYDHTGHQRFSGAVNQFDYHQPTPRKESAMRKLDLKDVAAITHAERYYQKDIVPNMTARHRQELEDDLVRLAEIQKMILDSIYAPGLPLNTQETKPESDGDESKTTGD